MVVIRTIRFITKYYAFSHALYLCISYDSYNTQRLDHRKISSADRQVNLLCNKTNQMHQFHKFILSWNSTCFGQFACPSSGVYSLYTQQWYMSYRFVDSFRAGPGWNEIPSWSCSFATRSRMELRSIHHQEFLALHRLWYILCSCNDRLLLKFQFYWYYESKCFGQPFCPSSGVLSLTSALVHFMQL